MIDPEARVDRGTGVIDHRPSGVPRALDANASGTVAFT